MSIVVTAAKTKPLKNMAGYPSSSTLLSEYLLGHLRYARLSSRRACALWMKKRAVKPKPSVCFKELPKLLHAGQLPSHLHKLAQLAQVPLHRLLHVVPGLTPLTLTHACAGIAAPLASCHRAWADSPHTHTSLRRTRCTACFMSSPG